MKDQVGFFNALLGTCRGTEIFPRLCRNSWGRTVLHLFLLSVFCAFAVTLVQAALLVISTGYLVDGGVQPFWY